VNWIKKSGVDPWKPLLYWEIHLGILDFTHEFMTSDPLGIFFNGFRNGGVFPPSFQLAPSLDFFVFLTSLRLSSAHLFFYEIAFRICSRDSPAY